MQTLLAIIIIWFVTSIPAALIVGRLLGAASRMQEEATVEILATATGEVPVVAVS